MASAGEDTLGTGGHALQVGRVTNSTRQVTRCWSVHRRTGTRIQNSG